ncbi:MAG: glycosyltransferase family 2 protein [Myxococcales bacterium]|nr:glycosyltransferase family 2 protein [Myxococcales bacterium]
MSNASQASVLVSIVVPCLDEEEVFPLLQSALLSVAKRMEPAVAVEFVLVDDGSQDATWSLICAFARVDARVRGVSLSRNFGQQMAITCGYDVARGDAVVSMDADLQDPPELVPQLVEVWQTGADVVYAVRSRRRGEGLFKRASAAFFYRLLRWIGASTIREASGDFRLLSRRALDALGELREQHRFVRGMVGWVGFKSAEIEYERAPSAAGRSKYPLTKMLRLATDAMVSFSVFPLRLTFVFAGILALFVLGYVVNAALQWFVLGVEPVRGWMSLLVSVMAFGALNLFCIGIMGEYVGRIYEQVKGRPLYVVRARTPEP